LRRQPNMLASASAKKEHPPPSAHAQLVDHANHRGRMTAAS
jgi:hypothetical protein